MKVHPAFAAGLVAGEPLGIAQVAHLDAGTAGPQHPVATDLHHRRGGHQHDDDEGRHAGSHRQGDRGIDRGEHQCGHRSAQGGGDQQPQARTQSFPVEHGLLAAAAWLGHVHYPRCVTETVDVLIIAPDVPAYSHPGDAGADLVSAEAVRLEPGQRALVGTGVRIALPDGYAAFVVPRSGLAAKHGITIVNAPGTVDAGYRGEIKVALLNTDREHAFDIAPGDRIAQLIVMPVTRAAFIPVDDLPDSVRGAGGFGSTGYQKDGATA